MFRSGAGCAFGAGDDACAKHCPQVGFVVRLDGHRLMADLEEELPDFEFAFESTGVRALGKKQANLLLLTRCHGL